ncbi:MAG: hypothetical protein JRG80_16360 [Deltaproteobacteria bacterium]|nr:hypothetical protein [Deltaproteobacteria bacterium]
MGLEGTGSFDYECKDVFVRESWTYPLFTREPKRGGGMYRMGIFAITGAGHAAWALGVGRRALDEINTLARGHTRMGHTTVLAERPTFQKDYIRAEAELKAARLLVVDVFSEVQRKVDGGADVSIEDRAQMRTAASYATDASKDGSAVGAAHRIPVPLIPLDSGFQELRRLRLASVIARRNRPGAMSCSRNSGP